MRTPQVVRCAVRGVVIASVVVAACSFSARSPGQHPDDAHDDTMIVVTPDGGPCTTAGSSCASIDVLRSCTGSGAAYVDTMCGWGCVATPGPHCGSFAPTSNGVEPTDLVEQPGLGDVTIDGSLTTDTGSIAGTTTRSGTGVSNGVGFRIHNNVAIFTAKSFHIGTLTIGGSIPVAFVATTGDITLTGVTDATGTCSTLGAAGPGGFAGATGKGANGDADATTNKGGGAGAAVATSGGGGAGHGGTGGAGTAAVGGMPYGDDAISTLSGGAGGGAGNGGGNYGRGGGGGGAVQLVTASSIIVEPAGGINAGGCGGDFGLGNADSGGGGGAGGTLLLEARTITVSGALAVNGGGGGGGGGGNAGPGDNGSLSRTAAAGGVQDGNNEYGGAGGAGSNANGSPGGNGTNPGGGGGAIGRIRFNTFRAMNLTTSGATLSPDLTDQASTCTSGSAAVD